jgi:hypothetical protein
VDRDHRGQGIFTEFLERVEFVVLGDDRPVFIENVMERRFQEFFLRRGYEPSTPQNNMPLGCFLMVSP